MSENYTKGKWEKNNLEIKVAGRGIVARCPTTNTGGTMECVANAERICQCVNNFDDLLETCKELLQAYRLNRKQIFGTDAIEEAARQAITKAEA